MVDNETSQNVHRAIERLVNESLDGSIVIGARGSLNPDVPDCVVKSVWGEENKLIYGLVRALESDPEFEALVLKALMLKNIREDMED
ncbi:hypothetical protein [Limosilactobacillus antri]|uniref:hypothetical protein n=1 Tax=Limosilactobacillus antri TaxID=227943 RepID=UPI001F55F921|nr:hypothetical protein [Limosilactobacillus antri]